MQRHLEVLTATLPALPRDAGASRGFVHSSVKIGVRLDDLYERIAHGGGAAAAAESAALLRQLAALGGDTMSAVGRRLAASSGPAAEATLLSLCRLSWAALALAGQLERQPAGGVGTGSMPWEGLLAWPAAALSAAATLLPLAGPDTHGKLLKAACGIISVYLAASSRVGADVVAKAQSHLPAALRIVLHTAGRLAMPGQESFEPRQWLLLLESLGVMFSTKEYGEAAAAALAAAAPDSKPGRQLATCLLDFVCCLAEKGPPASCAAAPDTGAAAHDGSIVQCWQQLVFLNASPTLGPLVSIEAVRGARCMRLVTALAGVLERLHEQQRQHQRQQHADAGLGLPIRQAAQAQLFEAGAACGFTATVLASYQGVLEKLLPPPQAAGQGPLQGSLLHAAQKGLQFAWHAVRSLPHAAAVFAASVWAASWDSEEESAQTRSAVYGFADHARNAGVMLARIGLVGNEPAQSQLELLAGFEAALRCAPGLQRHFAPAVADLDIPTNFACSASCAALCCLRWAAQPGLQLTTDEAERLLAAAAALACTTCKCAVLWADKAAVADVAGAAEAAQAAPAGGGGRVACAAPVLGPALPDLQGTLLNMAGNCATVAESVAQHAAPSARSHSLLRCVRLQRAEVFERLLPLLPQDAQDAHARRVQDAGVPSTSPLAQQQGEEAAASLRALTAARRCCHMGCTNLEGSSEVELPTKQCSGCWVARFCSEECSRAAWRAHKQVCRQLAAEAAQAGQAVVPGEQAGGNENRTPDSSDQFHA